MSIWALVSFCEYQAQVPAEVETMGRVVLFQVRIKSSGFMLEEKKLLCCPEYGCLYFDENKKLHFS